MSDEQTTQVQRRRASDQESKQRVWSGWIGMGMSISAFVYGLAVGAWPILLASFIGVAVSGNRLPYAEARKFLPWVKE